MARKRVVILSSADRSDATFFSTWGENMEISKAELVRIKCMKGFPFTPDGNTINCSQFPYYIKIHINKPTEPNIISNILSYMEL